MNLIGLSGYMSSGKSLVGKIIQYHTRSDKKKYSYEHLEKNGIVYSTDWRIKGFSQKLKKIASLLTGISEERFENQEFKKTLLSEEWNHETTGDGFQVRKFLQFLGTNCIRDRLHENAWINALFADYKSDIYYDEDMYKIEEYPSWIITDCRFPNEVEAIKQRGGIIVRINRAPQSYEEALQPTKLHSSETSLDSWEFDYRIDNNGSIEELIENVRKMLIHYEII